MKFLSIEDIYQNSSYDFNRTFNQLHILNQILQSKLPDNLSKFCHVGAFDKTTVVIFVSNSQVIHLLNGLSNQILQAFYSANYSFDNLSIKIRIPTNQVRHIEKNSADKEKLARLASAIGKPELVNFNPALSDDDDEIKL